jgi:uncharacterized membrane protein YfcA
MTESDETGPRSVHQQLVTGAHLREPWDALGTLLSAMLVFGLPAWWLSEALDWRWVLPVGLVAGMGAAIGVVWVRYGVHRP